jgi:hypothetical protein
MTEHKNGKYKPMIHFVFGEKDDIINQSETQKIIKKEGYETYLIFEHGHKTPIELFKKIIIEITENEI